jgi:hypothetical protein
MIATAAAEKVFILVYAGTDVRVDEHLPLA